MNDWHRNQQPVNEDGYTTDLIAIEVVHLIAGYRDDPRSERGKKPFFIYVPFNAVHGPLEEIPRYVEKHGKRYDALKCMDDAVGRIVGALDQDGYGENTLVIFSNDNGGLREEMNAPYRGTKNTKYEGGVRVPCVMRWPGRFKPGSKHAGLMHITDLFPTFVSIAGAEKEQERPLDGMDMTSSMLNGTASPRDEIVLEVSGSVRFPAIMRGNYKLIGEELYDIAAVPSEKNDIADDKPEIAADLKERVTAYGKERKPLGDLPLLMTPALPWVY